MLLIPTKPITSSSHRRLCMLNQSVRYAAMWKAIHSTLPQQSSVSASACAWPRSCFSCSATHNRVGFCSLRCVVGGGRPSSVYLYTQRKGYFHPLTCASQSVELDFQLPFHPIPSHLDHVWLFMMIAGLSCTQYAMYPSCPASASLIDFAESLKPIQPSKVALSDNYVNLVSKYCLSSHFVTFSLKPTRTLKLRICTKITAKYIILCSSRYTDPPA